MPRAPLRDEHSRERASYKFERDTRRWYITRFDAMDSNVNTQGGLNFLSLSLPSLHCIRSIVDLCLCRKIKERFAPSLLTIEREKCLRKKAEEYETTDK